MISIWGFRAMSNNSDYAIFLDDERFPPYYSRFFDGHSPIIIRSHQELMKCIQDYGMPILISLDHDLGTEKTGLDCLKDLIIFCARHNKPFPEFQVHSMNPIGAKALLDYIEWACDNEADIREMYTPLIVVGI